jgi:hypothetical protein
MDEGVVGGRMVRIANATTEPEEHGDIKITPEMIEAGCRAIAGYNYNFDLEEEIVERIFRAMITAKYLGVSAAPTFDWYVPTLTAWMKALEKHGYNVL